MQPAARAGAIFDDVQEEGEVERRDRSDHADRLPDDQRRADPIDHRRAAERAARDRRKLHRLLAADQLGSSLDQVESDVDLKCVGLPLGRTALPDHDVGDLVAVGAQPVGELAHDPRPFLTGAAAATRLRRTPFAPPGSHARPRRVVARGTLAMTSSVAGLTTSTVSLPSGVLPGAVEVVAIAGRWAGLWGREDADRAHFGLGCRPQVASRCLSEYPRAEGP